MSRISGYGDATVSEVHYEVHMTHILLGYRLYGERFLSRGSYDIHTARIETKVIEVHYEVHMACILLG